MPGHTYTQSTNRYPLSSPAPHKNKTAGKYPTPGKTAQSQSRSHVGRARAQIGIATGTASPVAYLESVVASYPYVTHNPWTPSPSPSPSPTSPQSPESYQPSLPFESKDQDLRTSLSFQYPHPHPHRALSIAHSRLVSTSTDMDHANTGFSLGLGGTSSATAIGHSMENSWRADNVRSQSTDGVLLWAYDRPNTNANFNDRTTHSGYSGEASGSRGQIQSQRAHVAPAKSLAPRPLPLPVGVWAGVMDTSRGRDKVLKCLQYSLRTYLYVLSLIAGVRPLSRWFAANSKRMRLAVTSLSLTRKCLLLLNPLHPLTHLLSPSPTSALAFLKHLMDLASALSDDIFCLSRLGLVSRRTGRVADKWANRFWFLTTIMGLWKIYTREIPQLRARRLTSPSQATQGVGEGDVERELRDAEWTSFKLWSDFAFVSYDIFNLTWFKEPVQCVSGLTAAFISTSKLYDQHWDSALGKG